jgi:hypothetical protein
VKSVEYDRNGSATTTPYFITNNNSGVNAHIHAENIGIDSSPVSIAVFKAGGTVITTPDCDLYGIANNYPAGWCYLSSNKTAFYGSNNGVAMSTVGNIGGTGTGFSLYITGNGTQNQGSSTVDIGGTFGCLIASTAFSTTISGVESGNQGACTYELARTAGANATFTMPLVASTGSRFYRIVNSSAQSLSVAASGTDSFSVTGSNATATAMTVASHTAIQIQSNAIRGYWMQE